MKQRTFFTTLLLFLLVFNSGIAGIAGYTYSTMLSQAKTDATTDHYYIASGLLSDVVAIDSRDADVGEGVRELMQPYNNFAFNQGANLALYDDGRALIRSYNSYELPDSIDLAPGGIDGQNATRQTSVVVQDGDAKVVVLGLLPAPYDNYALYYEQSFTDAYQGWQQMRNLMLGFGLAASLLLALALLLLLNRLFKPLQDISATAQSVAQGNYRTRLPVKGKDELAEVATSINHMTGEIRRQMDELVETANSKQLFIDNFAHETKTPLTAIQGYAEYIQRADLTDEDRHFALEAILAQTKRMKNMTAQMMEMTSLRSGDIEMSTVDVAELFARVELAMRSLAEQQGARLRFDAGASEIYGNAELLESLLTNLIDNAVKAGKQGDEVEIRAESALAAEKDFGAKHAELARDGWESARATEQDSGTKHAECARDGWESTCATEQDFGACPACTLTVKDHGKGIAADLLPKITQAYYRVDKHRAAKDGGAGLGLAICQQIADVHGAKLKFESEPGKGTTVKVVFTTLKHDGDDLEMS